MSNKSLVFTLLLNFLIPGVGHLYASRGDRGAVILICCLLLGALAPITAGLTLLPLFILAIVALGQSPGIVRDSNVYAVSVPTESERLAEIEQMRQRRTAEDEKRQQAIENRKVVGRVLARDLEKVRTLLQSSVLTEKEAADEKRRIFSESTRNGWTDEDALTFLGPFSDLLASGVVDQTDMAEVKNTYGALKKTRPSR